MAQQTEPLNGTLLAYWEQGWEGRIEFAFQPDASDVPIFLQDGHRLTIFRENGSALWSGTIRLVPRRIWDKHQLETPIWSYRKQRGVTYAIWMGWIWRDRPLKASLEVP
jgi:hypothetical protein